MRTTPFTQVSLWPKHPVSPKIYVVLSGSCVLGTLEGLLILGFWIYFAWNDLLFGQPAQRFELSEILALLVTITALACWGAICWGLKGGQGIAKLRRPKPSWTSPAELDPLWSFIMCTTAAIVFLLLLVLAVGGLIVLGKAIFVSQLYPRNIWIWIITPVFPIVALTISGRGLVHYCSKALSKWFLICDRHEVMM